MRLARRLVLFTGAVAPPAATPVAAAAAAEPGHDDRPHQAEPMRRNRDRPEEDGK